MQRELLKLAQNYYQLVGSAASECGRECLLITCPVCVFSCKCMSCGARPTYSVDTIPGRHCMASCYFLLKQFEDVLIYLNSIKVCPKEDSIKGRLNALFLFLFLFHTRRVTFTMMTLSTSIWPKQLVPLETSRKPRKCCSLCSLRKSNKILYTYLGWQDAVSVRIESSREYPLVDSFYNQLS